MTYAQRILAGLVSFTLLAAGQLVAGQGTPPAEAQAAAAPTAPARIVSREVLKDGTVELKFSDGSTRRISPDAPATSGGPAPSPDAEAALRPAKPPEWLKDRATNQAFLEAMGEYYRYHSSGFRHRSRVFEWQLVSSRIIFGTVLMLVAAGMAFAAIQFGAGLRRGPTDAGATSTQLDVSATGLKVSSPVLGVIILVISLAFFYLYLVYVYPISEIM